jgi:hypothetical protein
MTDGIPVVLPERRRPNLPLPLESTPVEAGSEVLKPRSLPTH